MSNTIKANESSTAFGGRSPVRVIQVHAAAGPARIRRRHWGVLASFVALVVAPLAALGVYLAGYAVPQYASSTGFTVRQAGASGGSDVLGGLTQLALGPATVDGDILFEFIESQAMVARLQDRVDIAAHYSAAHPQDPVFALAPDPSIEDLVRHWQRVVRTSYNQANGLIEVRVRAYSPEMAQALAAVIIAESQELVNDLNAAAREDSIHFAESDLSDATERLRVAREAVTEFRSRTPMIDPAADMQRQQGVLTQLERQLSEALVEYDLMAVATPNAADRRLREARERIDAIRARADRERADLAHHESGAARREYAAVMTEYEGLVAEQELAQQAYAVAMTALDMARGAAARQRRYLAVFIEPTAPETADFPRAEMILPQAALFLLLGWSILVLIGYSIRDRR